MRLKEYIVLGILAALWGASFLFIKVAVRDMSPLLLVIIRLVFGTLGLLLILPFKPPKMQPWRKYLTAFALVALFNSVIPYLTIGWGEIYVTSGMAAILNATTPLVLVILSIWWPGGERLTWLRLAGVLIGFIGVGILIGPAAFATGGSNIFLLGILSCLVGAASYSLGSLLAHRLLKGIPPIQQAIGQIGGGAIMLAPVTGTDLILHPLTRIPSAWAIAAALALALGGTSLAYLCYFWLIEHVGPTRTVIVTYLLPCMALVYGLLFLHETPGINAIAGLILVLSGIFLTGKKSSTGSDSSKLEATTSSLPEEKETVNIVPNVSQRNITNYQVQYQRLISSGPFTFKGL